MVNLVFVSLKKCRSEVGQVTPTSLFRGPGLVRPLSCLADDTQGKDALQLRWETVHVLLTVLKTGTRWHFKSDVRRDSPTTAEDDLQHSVACYLYHRVSS